MKEAKRASWLVDTAARIRDERATLINCGKRRGCAYGRLSRVLLGETGDNNTVYYVQPQQHLKILLQERPPKYVRGNAITALYAEHT
jgi:hypothetical protein